MGRIPTVLGAVFLSLLGSCRDGAGPAAVQPQRERPPYRQAPQPLVSTEDAPVQAADAQSRPPVAAAAPTAAKVEGSYPPPQLAPPYTRSAQAGDGVWTPLATATDRAANGTPVLHKTTLHPHPDSRFIALTVVAIDLKHVTLGFVPGTDDLGEGKVPFAPGLVAVEHQPRLLAIFNGGFQPQHGGWGMKLAETTVVPPREVGCTIALFADGAVAIRSWANVAGRSQAMTAFRQTPPCLVEQGDVHAELLAGRDKAWGGRAPGVVTRRRSALGLDRTGRTLFYAVSVEATPKLLAEGMRAVGAHDAAELDINWNWTRFLLFGDNQRGELRVSSSFVPGTYGKSTYVERPSERDFFYILRK